MASHEAPKMAILPEYYLNANATPITKFKHKNKNKPHPRITCPSLPVEKEKNAVCVWDTSTDTNMENVIFAKSSNVTMTGMQCYFQCFDWNNKCSKFRRARVWGILTKTVTQVDCESRVTGRGGFPGKERSRRIEEETSTRHMWEWTECGLHQMNTLTESQLGMDLNMAPWRNHNPVIL